MPEPVSPLQGTRLAPRPSLGIADRGVVGQITLRADLSEPAVAEAVRDVAGVGLPGAWEAAFDGERGAIWMSPDELLLLLPLTEVDDVLARVGTRLAEHHHMALDVSHARAVLRLTGGHVAETLAKGAPVDLSEAAFPVGRSRRTHLGGIAVAFWRRDESVWEIACFRSMAHHLLGWLEAAGHPQALVGYR